MNTYVDFEIGFYKEICNASELSEEKEVCLKYNKDFKKVRSAINQAMKIDMMSSNNDIAIFHQRIISQLKKRKL